MEYKGHINTLVEVICIYNTDIFIHIFYYDSQNGWEPDVPHYDLIQFNSKSLLFH